MNVVRCPKQLELRPFVRMLWYSEEAATRSGRERLLPGGDMHLVFRLCDEPIRVFQHLDDTQGTTLGYAVVGGVRDAFYIKDLLATPVRSVGAMLLPSASLSLFDAPAGELSGRHTRLDDLWNDASNARTRLLEANTPDAKLDLFEALLAARLPRVRGIHPAVALALERLQTGIEPVGDIVAESGYSHRRLSSLFGDAVGLTPKRYSRVRRFQHAVRALATQPAMPLVDIAAAHGYADQAHFTRDFLNYAGVTPGQYRTLSPHEAMHVPIG